MIHNETHLLTPNFSESPVAIVIEACSRNPSNQNMKTDPQWSAESWKTKTSQQQPTYIDQEALQKELGLISGSPSIVSVEEIQDLRSQLEKCEGGNAFFIQMGDCSERFDELDEDFIQLKLDSINAASKIFSSILGKDCVMIGRIAGQFAKPRTCEYETFPDGSILPNYRGDIVNSLHERQPNPILLTQGYLKSVSTMNLIRQLQNNEIINTNNISNSSKVIHAKQKQDSQEDYLSCKLLSLNQKRVFISHEGLLLNYEQCFIREIEGKVYNTGAHLLWIGDRTRQIEGAHIEMFRGVSNPIGLKIGSNIDGETLKNLVQKLNPQNEIGKLIIICRFGNKLIEKHLPSLIKAKISYGLNFIWCCDPMHGNTYSTSSGIKTRKVTDILSELQKFISILNSFSQNVGGVHLETSPIQVTECIGLEIEESMLSSCYTSSCDPRLNLQQTQYICNQLAQSLKQLFDPESKEQEKYQPKEGQLIV